MSGDLEDFLRRAAQRRQAKAAQSAQPAAKPRQRPQYSNSRTERVARNVESNQVRDEILVAEVVEDDIATKRDQLEAKRERQRAETAADQAKTAATRSATNRSPASSDASSAALSSQAGMDLLAALRSPGGVRQAILLKEILDRPTHRW